MNITIHIPHWIILIWPYAAVSLFSIIFAWIGFCIILDKALGPFMKIIEKRFGRW